jgi:hypothetical protein
MKKQITFLLFMLLFALTSSQVMAQQDVLYLIQDGTNDSDYLSNGGSLPGQDQIIKMLEADANFTVSWAKIDQAFVVTSIGSQAAGANAVASPINFTGFELVITSENMASSNTIFKVGNPLHPDQLTIPVIYDKAYVFRGSSAALATSATSAVVRTQEFSMTVADATSPIFNGLTVSNGSSIDLLRTTSDDKGNNGAYAIDVVIDLEISAANTLLASVPQITNAATAVGINYFPTGTQVGTTADGIFAQNAISMPFSWGAMVKKDGGNITSEFLTIWRNAAYMLTGQTPPSTLYVNPVYDNYEIVTETTVYDFRDGSIIPNPSDGYVITGSPEALAAPQTDRLKSADGAIDYRHIAGDNYYSSTYGLNMKAGSRVFIKPVGTAAATVKVPLAENSDLGLELKLPNNNNKAFIKVNGVNTSAPGTTTYQETLNATASTGNDLNEFITIEYYPKGGQNLEFMAVAGAGSDIYLPYIEVTHYMLQAKPQEIAYVQKAGFGSGTGASASTNDPIFKMFQADTNFNITVLETDGNGTGLDLTGYDLVIAQETFGSSDGIWTPTGPLGIKNITIPVIHNKTWALRNGKAISSAGAGVVLSTSVTVAIDPSNQTNTLFNGIDFSGGNDVRLYSELAPNNGANDVTGTNAFDILQNVEIGTTGTNLASVSDLTTSPDTSIIINEIPLGTQLGTAVTDVLQVPMVAFSFNYGAIIKNDGANISPEALTIWRNAAYKLTGLSVPTTLVANPDFTLSIDKVGEVSRVSTNVRAIGNRIYVSNVKSGTEVNIYAITGALVKTIKTNEDTNFAFKSGLWIATVKTFEGTKAVKFITH